MQVATYVSSSQPSFRAETIVVCRPIPIPGRPCLNIKTKYPAFTANIFSSVMAPLAVFSTVLR